MVRSLAEAFEAFPPVYPPGWPRGERRRGIVSANAIRAAAKLPAGLRLPRIDRLIGRQGWAKHGHVVALKDGGDLLLGGRAAAADGPQLFVELVPAAGG